MTVQQFKQWLKSFDVNGDNRISQQELCEAVRFSGRWFAGRKGKKGINCADKNRNGFVDEDEIENLLDFA
ncbi:hypothetical protein, partial [Salmonella sp. s58078]|uniref:hypothetical protein n=1 Tax=Salmonella sp. s58078 TaxID=3159699 RepID=UPI0039810D17